MKAIRVTSWLRFFTLAIGLMAGLAPANGSSAQGQAQGVEDRVPDIIVFTHITCPHCTDAKVYLAELQRRQPELKIWVRELTEDRRAGADLQDIARMAGVPNPGVPAWVLGGEVFMVGFGTAATTGRQIEQVLGRLGLPPAPAVVVEPGPEPEPQSDPEPISAAPPVARSPGEPTNPAHPPVEKEGAAASRTADEPVPGARPAQTDPASTGLEDPAARGEPDGPRLRLGGSEATSLSLPFFGDVDAASMSLPALTGLIAFVDGFNPCSLWVLTFLLGIVIYSGSRKKILLIGVTFLLVTATAYGLFIVGMFGTLRYLAYLSWITFAVAGMALIFALVNIKDYFWFKQGVSFTISDKHKPKLFQRTRNLMHPGRSVPALLVGTVVLALGITLVELPCTAGFPMVWTGIITSQGVAPAYFAALLAFYLLVYLSIELVIFGSVVVSMKRSRFEEKHGRILKLIGGMIMLALAVTLVLAPDTMHSLGGTLLVFGGAIGAAALILLLHRRVLPRFGIVIGSEELEAEVAPAMAGAGPETPGD
jgi:cytochrome c biogenesis protein CcdA/glutaredoxin